MAWLTTNVCTDPARASATSSSLAPPHPVHAGWTDGGVLTVAQSMHRAPSRPIISSSPRTNAALPGGTAISTVSPDGTSSPRARSTSGYDAGRPDARTRESSVAPGTRRLDLDRHTRHPTAAVADDGHHARRSQRAQRPEEGRGGTRVAGRLVGVGRRDDRGAHPPRRRGTQAAVGVGERPGVDAVAQCRGDVVDQRQEDLLAEETRIVEVARRRLAVAAVAVEHGPSAGRWDSVAGPSPARSTNAAAPAPARASNAVPSPGRSASAPTTRATRAEPAATASHAPSSASIPASVEPLVSAPATSSRRPSAAASIERLGPSANGGRLVPHHKPSTSVESAGLDAPPAPRRRRSAFPPCSCVPRRGDVAGCDQRQDGASSPGGPERSRT